MNIKDLILDDAHDTMNQNDPAAAKKQQRKLAEYEVAVVSGPDFAVRRKGKYPKLLVILPSKKQYYIKNEHDGTMTPLDLASLKKFLSDVPSDGFALEDNDGNIPFWVSCMEKGKEWIEAFMKVINSDLFCFYFSKNLLSFTSSSKLASFYNIESNLKNLDYKKAKGVFDVVCEFLPQDKTKTLFSQFVAYGGRSRYSEYEDNKYLTLFQCLLSPYNHYVSSYYRYNNDFDRYNNDFERHNLLYEWLEKNWGIEGVKQFIRAYLENPISELTTAFCYSIIQNTTFNLQDFLDLL